MRSINDYSEYLSTLGDTKSKDPVIRDEAKKALDVLRQEDPGQYTLYRALNKEIDLPETMMPKKEKKVYAKGQFIREHPEINVEDERKKARIRLLKGANGLPWRFDTPTWISDEDMLKSLDRLSLPDLITISGKPVPRQTLIRRCIKLAVAERRIDEEKLHGYVISMFVSYYNGKIIGLKYPYLFEPVKRMLQEEATVEELADVSMGWGVDLDKLIRLINKKEIKVTEEDIRRSQKKAEKQSRNAIKRAKRRAEKEAALKKTLEEENKGNTENN